MTLIELKEIVNTSNNAVYNIKVWGVDSFVKVAWNNIPNYIKNSAVARACPIRIYCGCVKEWNVVIK